MTQLTQGGYAIHDAKKRGNPRYIDRAWLTRSEAVRELDALLRYHPAGSEWHRRLTVEPCALSVADWERCVRETEREQRPVGGTGKPGVSRVDRRRAA